MNKYRNKKTMWNGMLFDSKLEAKMYSELWLRQKAGEIDCLARQIPIALVVSDIKICDWVVDACYYDKKLGTECLRDAKGKLTAEGSIKFKLARALFPNSDIDFYPSVAERKAKSTAKAQRTRARNELRKL